MKSIAILPVILLAGALAAPAQKITTEFDDGAAFSDFKTYFWRPGRIHTKNPALDNTLVENKVEKAITARLWAKGFHEATRAAEADVIVSYSIGIAPKIENELYPAGWRGWGTQVVRVQRTQGTLVIDLISTKTKKLVWRSLCADTVDDAQKFEQRLDRDVKKAFDKYPPKPH